MSPPVDRNRLTHERQIIRVRLDRKSELFRTQKFSIIHIFVLRRLSTIAKCLPSGEGRPKQLLSLMHLLRDFVFPLRSVYKSSVPPPSAFLVRNSPLWSADHASEISLANE